MKWAAMDSKQKGRRKGSCTLGWSLLSPDSKSPATDNNKSIATAESRDSSPEEKSAIETVVCRITGQLNLSRIKKKWQLLPWKKRDSTWRSREVEVEGLLTWRGTLKRGEALAVRRLGSAHCAFCHLTGCSPVPKSISSTSTSLQVKWTILSIYDVTSHSLARPTPLKRIPCMSPSRSCLIQPVCFPPSSRRRCHVPESRAPPSLERLFWPPDWPAAPLSPVDGGGFTRNHVALCNPPSER
ncbi:hypothetical protein BDV12DRAFT_61005 [Aspergillus spectabilis]